MVFASHAGVFNCLDKIELGFRVKIVSENGHEFLTRSGECFFFWWCVVCDGDKFRMFSACEWRYYICGTSPIAWQHFQVTWEGHNRQKWTQVHRVLACWARNAWYTLEHHHALQYGTMSLAGMATLFNYGVIIRVGENQHISLLGGLC